MAKLALQGNDAGTGTFTLHAPATNLNRNLVLPDVDGTLSTMEQVKLPIGSFMWFTGTVAPEAFIVADGQLRSRTTFPDLWAFAQASGNISVDDASWTKGQYSPGDGSTTFRVPLLDDFIRGAYGSRLVGSYQEDAFKAHSHTYRIEKSTGGAAGSSVLRHDQINTETSTVGDDETRPKNVAYLPCIKAYDVISDPTVLNAVEVVNEISRLESEKLRKDENINLGVSVAASGTAVDFVGIPAGVKRVTVVFDGVSTNGTSGVDIRLGTITGIDSSGYVGSAIGTGPNTLVTTPFSTGIALQVGINSTTTNRYGKCIISNVGNNKWTGFCIAGVGGGNMGVATAIKQLSGPLDRIRIATVNGTDQFDNGTINISWEF